MVFVILWQFMAFSSSSSIMLVGPKELKQSNLGTFDLRGVAVLIHTPPGVGCRGHANILGSRKQAVNLVPRCSGSTRLDHTEVVLHHGD